MKKRGSENSPLITLIITLMAAAFIMFAAGCATVTENVIGTTIGIENYSKIEEIDLLLLEFRMTKDLNNLARAGEMLIDLIKDKSYNKEYEATLYGLAGEIEYLKGNEPGIKKNFEELKKRSESSDYFFILRALLEKKPEKKIEILTQALDIAVIKGKIYFYLAFLYTDAREYAKATASFDDAFKLLPAKYGEYYKKERDLAYQFIENPPDNAESKDLLKVEQISFSEAISLTLIQTDFLNHITPNKKANPAQLLDTLKEKGYIHESVSSVDVLCVRRDAAYLINNILAFLENAPGLKTRYLNQYKGKNKPSPVPDVSVDAYYFNAVLVVVEREIMELPDGINFLPDNSVSGIEFYEILNLLENKYY